MAPRFRNAQGLALGLAPAVVGAAGTLVGTLQVPSMLQDFVIDTTTFGLLTGLRVAGQSVMVSNKGASLAAFAPNAKLEGQRALGIPLDENQTVVADYTLIGAGTTIGNVGTDPIAPSDLVSINQLGPSLDYVAGLGRTTIPAGGDGTLICTILRDVVLGRLVITPETAVLADILALTVRSVTINQLEMLSGGVTPAGREVGVRYFGADASDQDGAVIAYPARENSTVEIQIHNYGGAPIDVTGAIMILPNLDLAA